MKILEVIFSLGSGGAEQFVVDLSNELSSKHEVVLLTLKDDSVENRDFYKNKLNNEENLFLWFNKWWKRKSE